MKQKTICKNGIEYKLSEEIDCSKVSLKRMLGEYVTAIIFDYTIKKILLKISLYNLFISITVIICTSY